MFSRCTCTILNNGSRENETRTNLRVRNVETREKIKNTLSCSFALHEWITSHGTRADILSLADTAARNYSRASATGRANLSAAGPVEHPFSISTCRPRTKCRSAVCLPRDGSPDGVGMIKNTRCYQYACNYLLKGCLPRRTFSTNVRASTGEHIFVRTRAQKGNADRCQTSKTSDVRYECIVYSAAHDRHEIYSSTRLNTIKCIYHRLYAN